MPNLDKSGPRGEGAKTGRGFGQCDPVSPSTGVGAGRGRGCRWNRGLGLGRGQGQQAVPNKTTSNDQKK